MTFDQITAYSDTMKSVISTAEKAAAAGLPVLLIGETGIGKDHIAEGIHQAVSATERTFHTFHCLNTDVEVIQRLEQLLQERPDLTLFCERIDRLSIPLQQTLVHVLQRADVSHQFIASIGEDPVELIASGTLVKELYYFFASFAIRIPPLRKRVEDIPPFVEAYIVSRKEMLGTALSTVDEEVIELFQNYSWPGNLREVELLLDEVSSMWTMEEVLTVDMLPSQFRAKIDNLSTTETQPSDFIIQSESKLVPLDHYLREAETYYLQKAMKLHDDNITKTANALGMSRQNLQYRLKKLKN